MLGLDSDADQRWGGLRVPHPEQALDKLIAASALLDDLTVVTRHTAFLPTPITKRLVAADRRAGRRKHARAALSGMAYSPRLTRMWLEEIQAPLAS